MKQEKLLLAAERCGFSNSGEKKPQHEKKKMTKSQMLKRKDDTNIETKMEGMKEQIIKQRMERNY
jgi:hypothetical protein